MVISFSEDKPYRQLKEVGAVVTFRAAERERTPRHRPQETWANRGRGEPKALDVTVRHLEAIRPTNTELRPYSALSGFETVGGWAAKIVELHGSFPDDGHLYLVTRRHDP